MHCTISQLDFEQQSVIRNNSWPLRIRILLVSYARVTKMVTKKARDELSGNCTVMTHTCYVRLTTLSPRTDSARQRQFCVQRS